MDSGAQHHRVHLGDGAFQSAGANVDRARPDEIEFNATNGFQDRVLHACRDLRSGDRSRLVVDLLPLSRGVGKRLGDFSRLAPTKLVRFQQDSYACDYFYGMDDRSRSCHYPLHGGAGRGCRAHTMRQRKIDCASTWSIFRRITWPLIKPTTLYVAIIATASSFLIFDTVFTMTHGGPGYATTTMVYKTYATAFTEFRFGYSSAMAVFLTVMVVGFNALQFKFLATDIEY